MKQRVLYYHATLLTGDVKQMLLPGGYVLICGDRIVDVGACADDKLPQAELCYDLAGQILMPGMISSHCHFYGQFVRGILAAACRPWLSTAKKWLKIAK